MKRGACPPHFPTYRPDCRWRQTTCHPEFLAALFDALDEVRRTGKRAAIKGYGGWHVSKIVKEDFA